MYARICIIQWRLGTPVQIYGLHLHGVRTFANVLLAQVFEISDYGLFMCYDIL